MDEHQLTIIYSAMRNPVGTIVVYFTEIETKKVCQQPKHTLPDKGETAIQKQGSATLWTFYH